MNNQLSILFFLYRSKVNGRDEMPVYCRVTLNSQRKQFTTGCFLKACDWDTKASFHKSTSGEAKKVNEKIKSIRKHLLRCYDALIKARGITDVQELYDSYSGRTVKAKTILSAFDHHLNQIKDLIGKDYSPATYGKFVLIRNHVSTFIEYQYKVSDLSLNQLRLGFLYDFDHYLKVYKKHNQNTVNKVIERVKKITSIALAYGWLSHDPFALYRKKSFTKEVVFLDKDELAMLEYCPLPENLNAVKNLFLFSCYTGLPYHELSTLRRTHVRTDNNGILWIEMIRKKTKRRLSVMVLPKALEILEYYHYTNNDGLLLPHISNQKLNVYLKELAGAVGINKHLTHHVARKTFATTVLLNNDIPIDVASFMLGHSKISTTEEFYAKVQRERVVLHMTKLRK